MVYLCGFCRCNHIIIIGVQSSVTDILPYGSIIQPGILQNHAKYRAKFLAREIADVIAIDQNGAFIHIIETHQKLDHRGLSRACRSDNRHFLPGLNTGTKIMDNGLTGVIAKLDVCKLYAPLNMNQRICIRQSIIVIDVYHGCIRGLLRFCKEFKYTLRRGCGLLKNVADIGNLCDRLSKLTYILNECLDSADI